MKETAQLEAQAYELEQKTALTAEAKNVLDSWVRYEGQVRQQQQRELADTVIAKIEKELEDPKVLKRILDQSIQDVEREYPMLLILVSDQSRHRLTSEISSETRHCNARRSEIEHENYMSDAAQPFN